ncbi:MAG TPA: VWA domain-containing protein [Blastocatellia bacterium]|nr:VWA domain-containing protein [Blastocatellia bacterium]
MRYRQTSTPPSFFLLALILILAGITAPAQQSQEQQKNPPDDDGVLALETNLVVLNVTVTDARERYVAGLREKDFRVFEDKAPQKIVSFSFEETPFAAVILLDTSASMSSRMSLARAACSHFTSGIREGDNVAIYSFGGTKVKMLQDFSEVKDVDPVIWETNADGMTPMYDGIAKAVEALAKRPERRRAILIVSDGVDTTSKHTLESAIRQALAAGITIYAVDMSESALHRTPARDNGPEVMKTLATKTGGRFYPTPGGSKLRDAFAETVDELRNQYTIAYEPANERRDGKWRAIEVHARQGALNVRTRQGYYAAKSKK